MSAGAPATIGVCYKRSTRATRRSASKGTEPPACLAPDAPPSRVRLERRWSGMYPHPTSMAQQSGAPGDATGYAPMRPAPDPLPARSQYPPAQLANGGGAVHHRGGPPSHYHHHATQDAGGTPNSTPPHSHAGFQAVNAAMQGDPMGHEYGKAAPNAPRPRAPRTPLTQAGSVSSVATLT